jgi:hypothetical protein
VIAAVIYNDCINKNPANTGKKRRDFMSKAEALHELYEICKNIDFEELDDITAQAKDKDEKEFYRVVIDCILQQRQKKIVADKIF